MDALGGRLARRPDDAALGKLFHDVCDRRHALESAKNAHEDGPLRCEPSPAIPQRIAVALVEIGSNFDEGKGPLEAGLERIA